MSYLLDTNVVIDYLKSAIPEIGMQLLNTVVDNNPYISVITKMEVLGFSFKIVADEKLSEVFVDGSIVLNINQDVVIKTIEIRKAKKIKLPDAIIAATALANNLSLITRNAGDFVNIKGLKIINPFEL